MKTRAQVRRPEYLRPSHDKLACQHSQNPLFTVNHQPLKRLTSFSKQELRVVQAQPLRPAATVKKPRMATQSAAQLKRHTPNSSLEHYLNKSRFFQTLAAPQPAKKPPFSYTYALSLCKAASKNQGSNESLLITPWQHSNRKTKKKNRFSIDLPAEVPSVTGTAVVRKLAKLPTFTQCSEEMKGWESPYP